MKAARLFSSVTRLRERRRQKIIGTTLQKPKGIGVFSTRYRARECISQPRCPSCWEEDTAIPKRAAVVNDAIPRYADEPRAWAPFECRDHLEEETPSPSPLILCDKRFCAEHRKGPKTDSPGKERTCWGVLPCLPRVRQGEVSRSNFSLPATC